MLPRLSHLLRLALVLAVASLSAAPLRVLGVSDDPKATAGTVAVGTVAATRSLSARNLSA